MGKIHIGVNLEFVRHQDKPFEWGVAKAAELGYIDEVIHPEETRPKLIRALTMLANKRQENLPRKHGNIPL